MTDRDIVVTPEDTLDEHGIISPYIIVAKPGIVALVIMATLSGMYMAQGGLPGAALMFWTLFGISMATAGSATLNNYIDRDIDMVMRRTSGRPLPSGALPPGSALAFGVGLSALSVLVMAWFVNPLTALLTALAIFIYVALYTMMTKRRTPLATFIGGVGGALPPVIGYTAVSGGLNAEALALFLIIFAWQHPHFWSLALKYMDEYRLAGVRNHPVAMGVDATKRRIALWAFIMAPVSTLPWFMGMSGRFYLVSALVIGVAHMVMSAEFMLSDRKSAMNLFFFSIIQLPALFCAMLIDIV